MTQSSEMMFRKRDNVSVTRNLKNEGAGSTEQRFSSNFSGPVQFFQEFILYSRRGRSLMMKTVVYILHSKFMHLVRNKYANT